MNETLSQIKKTLNNSENHHKYIYKDSSTKFIYESLKSNKIVGINRFLLNKIVEIKKKVIIKEKSFGLLESEKIEIGWVHLENLVRIYRLPRINGKIKNEIETKFDDVDYVNEIDLLKNKIIKAYYYFICNNQRYLLVGRISEDDVYPIQFDSFIRLQTPSEKTNVRLDKNMALYHSSNYQTQIGQTKVNGYYEVVSYFNGSKEAKVKTGQGKHWVKLNNNMPQHKEYPLDEVSMDILDFIIYLYYDNISKKNKISNMHETLKVMRKSIVVDHEDEELYLKKYLGEKNGNE